MIALVTYNLLDPYKKGLMCKDGVDVLVLPETFTPKGPERVIAADPNWQELMSHKHELERVIIFAGKKSSGALEIIELACASFADKKECLFFVLCDHELPEKIARLRKLGISETQYVSFEDGHLPCQESPILKGYMLDYIDRQQFLFS